MTEKIIKSRKRVKEHSEVLTQNWIVKKMLDLFEKPKEGQYNPYWRYLEPSCGTGNFLVEILERKLDYLKATHEDFPFNRLLALGSIYGVDIQPDNVEESRSRLFNLYKERTGCDAEEATAAAHMIYTNILIGDTINAPEKLVFTFYEAGKDPYSFITREQTLAQMLAPEPSPYRCKYGY